MTNLYSLAYISKNTISGSKQDVEEQIKDILKSAYKNNTVMGVTGALLYSGGYFCQVIEGPEEVLEELFETIEMDDRHGEVTVLHFEPIEERGFGEWAMAYAGIQEHAPFDIEGILASKDQLKMQDVGRHLVSTLDSLIGQHQEMLDT